MIFKELKETLKIFKKTKKITCLFIGNTVKKENLDFYITDVRENDKFIFVCAIIFSDNIARNIAKFVDGKVDIILIDTEKKTYSNKRNKIVNIERTTKEIIKKSKIFTYKGNDLTVDAADTFLSNYYLKDIRGVGGKKILIIGSGNIGFKLALKLVENGGNVFLYRRNTKILKNIVSSINFIKPKGTKSIAYKLKTLSYNLSNYDIIIGTTNGKAVLSKKHVSSFKKKVLILDIGKGIFEEKALQQAIVNQYNLFRLDITPAYYAFLENINSTFEQNNLGSIKTKKIGSLNLALKGILTLKDTIIVDQLNNATKIYGISDGFGSFKKKNDKDMKEIYKKLNIKI